MNVQEVDLKYDLLVLGGIKIKGNYLKTLFCVAMT